MHAQPYPLHLLTSGWEDFQQRLVAAIAPLTVEQLLSPIAPQQWSIGAVTQHLVINRVWWFHGWLGEGNGEPTLAQLSAWDPKTDSARSRPTADELVIGLGTTWKLVADVLSRWTPAELTAIPPTPPTITPGEQRVFGGRTRAWILWHVLEHELRHAGELNLALGTQGLATIAFL
jgi:uncharacterized damage-inducible protein DinB